MLDEGGTLFQFLHRLHHLFVIPMTYEIDEEIIIPLLFSTGAGFYFAQIQTSFGKRFQSILKSSHLIGKRKNKARSIHYVLPFRQRSASDDEKTRRIVLAVLNAFSLHRHLVDSAGQFPCDGTACLSRLAFKHRLRSA